MSSKVNALIIINFWGLNFDTYLFILFYFTSEYCNSTVYIENLKYFEEKQNNKHFKDLKRGFKLIQK